MKICIMQPYFFPYVGYFQMIKYVDLFIFYNDVNFIERGWINRNNILTDKGKTRITIPLRKASSNKIIKDVEVLNSEKQYWNVLKTIKLNYSKAPFYPHVFPLLEEVFNSKESDTIDKLARKGIEVTMDYLGIDTELVFSSEIDYCRTNSKVEKLIDIANKTDADTVIFPHGSKQLYSDIDFEKNNIKSLAITPQFTPYRQVSSDTRFVEGLSMIDLLMNLSTEHINEILDDIAFTRLDE
ncbi:MAG: hypothetical protein DRI88_03590 [Bacteroidetes bacterium]|nr:MAG: hypothetical protein DRI88_03590 [Bacteroidota bacterium]RLD70526.1 MAG: hypothetical protein DRI87_08210 [Bacteroidota bacterium]RLD85929.1 MAG: hypothetical protein DRJ02_09490 [Bacteroidota bacterium]